jgi:hypothetical protein
MIRQAMRFWTYPWTAPPADRSPKRRR